MLHLFLLFANQSDFSCGVCILFIFSKSRTTYTFLYLGKHYFVELHLCNNKTT